MEPVTYSFVTLSGETRFAREWPAREPASGVLIIIHGLSDHTGRFDHLGRFFSAEGFNVHGFDLKGNGMSPGKRGHFPSLEEIMDEIGSFTELLTRRFQGLPCFLYGQSMGGTLVLNYGIRRKPQIAGIIASSPWLRLAHPPGKTREIVVRWISRFIPALSRPNGIDPYSLSHDPAIALSYVSDPLVHRLITVGTYNLIREAGEYAIRFATEVSVPLLIMHGTTDDVTSVEGSREFFSRSPAGTIFRLWPGLRHELHNEPGKEEILNYVLHWTRKPGSE